MMTTRQWLILALVLAAAGCNTGCSSIALSAPPGCWFGLASTQDAQGPVLVKSVNLVISPNGGWLGDDDGKFLQPPTSIPFDASEVRIAPDGGVWVTKPYTEGTWFRVGRIRVFYSSQDLRGLTFDEWRTLGRWVEPVTDGVGPLRPATANADAMRAAWPGPR